jgi:hypothetical protein
VTQFRAVSRLRIQLGLAASSQESGDVV